jgi:acyl carrier protein
VTRDEIRERVLGMLAGVVPEVQVEQLDPDSPLREQYEMDSLDLLNFVLAVEVDFGISVPPTSYRLFATLDGAVACAEELLAETPARG